MFPPFRVLRHQLRFVIDAKTEQGHQTAGLLEELAALDDSYDRLFAFSKRLADLPLREDWTYVEPNDLETIWAECDPARPMGVVGTIDLADCARRVEQAFLASCCGCVLGKPLEINPTLDEIRNALSAIGEWPLRDYVSEAVAPHFGRRLHASWVETTRGRMSYVASDDDINYTIMGMLNLEKHGVNFGRDDLSGLWQWHLSISNTFGPERTVLLKSAVAGLAPGRESHETADWVNVVNPRDEYCGALIRADAYGYACPGRPALAAELAWRDAGFTHVRTGIYGTMFVAAVISLAQVMTDRLEIFNTALKFIPRRSRLYRIVSDSLNDVDGARDWLDGYQRIHGKYKEYNHCRVYQECGTLINTLRFARDIGDGICMQVMQGNDTDSFGATAGSILGCYFGPGHLDPRWLAPFNDDLRTALACFYDRSLAGVARRMGALPARIAAQLAAEPVGRSAEGRDDNSAGSGVAETVPPPR